MIEPLRCDIAMGHGGVYCEVHHIGWRRGSHTGETCPVADAYEAGRQAERAAITGWIHRHGVPVKIAADQYGTCVEGTLANLVDAIEAGAHVREGE